MQRRKFINYSAAATVGMLVPPMLKAATPNAATYGHGPRKYTLDTAWSKADVQMHPVRDCHEMVQDKKGLIYLLTNETKNNVLIYNADGKIVSSWGTEYPGAHGLTLHSAGKEEHLYICDNERHAVIKTDLKGKVLLTLGWPKESGLYEEEKQYVPTETAIGPNGDIYVADGYGKDYILRYNASGKYLGHFGGKGDAPEQLRNAHGITVDYRAKGKPTLIVTSREQNCFKRYTLDGQYLETIALTGAWVCRPVIKGQYLYVAVLQSSRNAWKQSGYVLVLDANNKVVSNIGGNLPAYNANGVPEEMYQTDAIFSYPHDVMVDKNDNLYVAQWNSGKVYPYRLQPVG